MVALRLMIFAIVVATAAPAFAVQPDEMLKDPVLEARARALSGELRCMVCQNQSIDDSEAPLARDLRILVRERLTAGDTDRQVLDFLVARYGDFVLLKPPFTWDTALLWLVSPLVLVGGAISLFVVARRRTPSGPIRGVAEGEPLSEAEQRRLAQVLEQSGTAAPVASRSTTV